MKSDTASSQFLSTTEYVVNKDSLLLVVVLYYSPK